MNTQHRLRRRQRGTTAVEAALVLPLFFLFMFGLFEVGRAFMLNHMIKAACRNAGRYGAAEGVTSEQVEQRVRNYLASAVDTDKVTIIVKDAAVYDTGEDDELPATGGDYTNLPDIETGETQSGQLYLVRATVDYNDVAFLPLRFLKGIHLTGQSIVRHE